MASRAKVVRAPSSAVVGAEPATGAAALATGAISTSSRSAARTRPARAASSSVQVAPPAFCTLRAVSSTSKRSMVARATASSSASEPLCSASAWAPSATSARRAVRAASSGGAVQALPALALKRRFLANSFLKSQSGSRPCADSTSFCASAETPKSSMTNRETHGEAASRASEMASGFIPTPRVVR